MKGNSALKPGMATDPVGGVGDTGDAGQTVFPGDDGTVDQHATAPLDDTGSQRHDKGHVGVHRVTDKDLA